MNARKVSSINPATGEVVADHPLLDCTEVERALDRAVTGCNAWRAHSMMMRADRLRALGAVLRERCEAIAATITLEMGKPITQSRAEVAKCADLCDWYANNGPALLADELLPVDGDGVASLAWLPIGLVLGVMPWNFPIWQVLRAAVPIMLAGNGFVLKHADNVLGCARLIADAVATAGIPDGVLTNLPVDQNDIDRLIADRRIAAVTVTAGVAAGAAVAAGAGRHLKKSVLELGGIDPFLVLADADLDQAVDAAIRSRFLNTGQVCIAAKRFIVEGPVVAEFTERFVSAVRRLKIGDPAEGDTFIGPLARTRGRGELHQGVVRSVAQGATLLAGGNIIDKPGFYYAPTVLTNVTPEMTAACQEMFGPVAVIMAASDAEHAVALANNSEYGLSAAIWSADRDRAKILARRVETGSVFINGISVSDPRVPIGGIKQSGYGRELSWFGIREFTNPQTLWIR